MPLPIRSKMASERLKPSLSSPTLAASLRESFEHIWRDQRSGRRSISHAEHAIATLERIITASRPRKAPSRLVRADGLIVTAINHPRPPGVRPEPGDNIKVTEAHLKAAVREWLAAGLTPATVAVRLTCMSVLGVTGSGCYPRAPRKLKWWMRPEQEARALAWLHDRPTQRNLQLADLIVWTTLTGLRIEESLRLGWSDIVERPNHTAISVPGTKTRGSQASLPISAAAALVLERRRTLHPASTSVFPLAYYQMGNAWREVREHIGLENPADATLKALRRNAARALTVNGMPA